MGSRKGSILYAMMVLVLCSMILVRNYRLLRSHVYIEKGIYSMDVRVHAFVTELEDMETYLSSTYGSAEGLMAYLMTGRKILYKDFTLSYDSSYNGDDLYMISVLDRRINYYRSVMVTEDEVQIRLINKGV
ncbi:hypothetical protein J3A84_00620 [Proteiniclasticum sp. SCR006]|uniref:Uncharacterized protein n=1 Tax=Proteiniclasticum aestuarii TaxID=2817862 RepID=A0A939H8W4_9CLOT|nr:hypothetical protein [Proteiniclasticum aestuarii]MBO1263542.1 hypothetical protein [Proteiniclasticum aestuarii]